MLRLAQKAFYPGPDSVPAAAHRYRLQVPRDDRVPRPLHGASSAPKLIVYAQRGSHRRRRQPIRARHPALLRAAEDPGPARRPARTAASTRPFGGARRDEEKSRAKERIYSFRDAAGQWDPKNQRPELWNLYNAPHRSRRKHPRLPALQLDRDGRLAVHPRREDPDRAAVLRQGARRCSCAASR